MLSLIDATSISSPSRDSPFPLSVASIALVAKKPDQFGKAMLLPAMVETFALFAFLISFLAVANVGGAL